MLTEPHYPSKWTVAGVFILILLLIGGIFFWAFILNRGTLVVSGERAFTLEAGGSTWECNTSCTVSLPPVVHHVIARATGFYDQKFQITIQRFKTLEKGVTFELIPKLVLMSDDLPEQIQTTTLEKIPEGKYRIGKLVFESLKNPVLRMVGERAVIIDEGRFFYVNLEQGSRSRKFDDSVLIQDAILSDDGARVLIFARSKGMDQLWIWQPDQNTLSLLSWYESPSHVVFEPQKSHRLLIISSSLLPSNTDTMLEKVMQSADGISKTDRLLRLNLDSEEIFSLEEFSDSEARQMFRRGERVFVQKGEIVQELLLQ